MSASTYHPRRLFLFAALSLVDLALTYNVVHAGGGYVYESNPIANEWLVRFGWTGLAFYKVLAMSIALFSVVLVSIYRPRTGSRLLNFACLALLIVVVYSFSLSKVIGNRLVNEFPVATLPSKGVSHDGRHKTNKGRLSELSPGDEAQLLANRDCFISDGWRGRSRSTEQSREKQEL